MGAAAIDVVSGAAAERERKIEMEQQERQARYKAAEAKRLRERAREDSIKQVNTRRMLADLLAAGDQRRRAKPPIEGSNKTSSFAGNQLKNGTSPYDQCFGSGRYGGSSWIKFDNGTNTDAVVCLVRVHDHKEIRNEYIRAGSSFEMSKIPSGTYYLKTYYGNDWNPNLHTFCGQLGGFESSVHFSKSAAPGDRVIITDDGRTYSTYQITLHTVEYGNMASETTTASDFFEG